jgi:hypothetical protein
MTTPSLVEIEPFEPLFGMPQSLALSASQLTLEETSVAMALDLNWKWHSQLPELSNRVVKWGDLTKCFALTFDGGVYGVAVWTRPVAANRMNHPVDHLAELRRLAIPDYAPKYTASRMLGRMARWFRANQRDVCRLLSYQVTDVHTGTIYKAANWHVANEQVNYAAWDTHADPRKAYGRIQNSSPKTRWELRLRPCAHEARPTEEAALPLDER